MRNLLVFVAATFITATASAQSADTTLWSEFKMVCIDTGAKPDAAEAAILKVGGVLQQRYKDSPSNYGSAWEHHVGGHQLMILTMFAPIPKSIIPDNLRMEQCQVATFGDDEASSEAFHKWIGFAPAKQLESQNFSSELYLYQETESGRLALKPDSEAEHEAKIIGREWQVQIQKLGSGTGMPGGVQLGVTRYYPAQDQSTDHKN